jgi:hypothetical protein
MRFPKPAFVPWLETDIKYGPALQVVDNDRRRLGPGRLGAALAASFVQFRAPDRNLARRVNAEADNSWANGDYLKGNIQTGDHNLLIDSSR